MRDLLEALQHLHVGALQIFGGLGLLLGVSKGSFVLLEVIEGHLLQTFFAISGFLKSQGFCSSFFAVPQDSLW